MLCKLLIEVLSRISKMKSLHLLCAVELKLYGIIQLLLLNSIAEATHKAAFLALPGLLQENVEDIFVSAKDPDEVSTACFIILLIVKEQY